MIAWLSGNLRHMEDATVIVDVQGVGYVLTVPTGVAAQHTVGDAIELHVHTHVREDQIALYGFDSPDQVKAFQLLLSVSGIGPKSAVSVLSVLGPAQLAEAVEASDIAMLKQAQGVGKRVAERIAMELKGKLEGLGGGNPAAEHAAKTAKSPTAAVYRDLRSALVNLQYRPKEIDATFDILARDNPDEERFEILLRAALKHLKKA